MAVSKPAYARLLIAAVIATAAIVATGTARARTRLSRQLQDPIQLGIVHRVAQDSRGFLWLGTARGLTRFDGVDYMPWRRDAIRGVVNHLVIAPNDTIAVAMQELGVSLVRGKEVTPLRGPDGEPVRFIRSIDFDTAGRLWVVKGKRPGAERSPTYEVRRMEADGRWAAMSIGADALDGEQPFRVFGLADGRVFVTTTDSVWQLDGADVPHRVADARWVVRVLADDRGGLWLCGRAHVYYVDSAGAMRVVSDIDGWDLAVRGDRAYALSFTHMQVLTPDRVEVLDRGTGGSRVIVDAEGSLWVGHTAGLTQMPEPDTIVWTAQDGLPDTSKRYLARGDEGVWMNTWRETVLIRPDGSVETVYPTGAQPCTDGDGAVWFSLPGKLLRRQGGVEQTFALDRDHARARCALAPDGTVWFARNLELWRTGPPSDPTPRQYRLPWPAGREVEDVTTDHKGRVWVYSERDVCVADPAEGGPDGALTWSCPPLLLPDDANVEAIAEADTGDIWVSVWARGLFRFDGAKWHFIESSRELPTRWLRNLRRSSRGGMWIVGHGVLQRVVAEPGADHWTVVETISTVHGVFEGSSNDVLETESGDLWISGDIAAPLSFVPAHVRRTAPVVPSAIAVTLRSDGATLAAGTLAELPPDTERVELLVRALSYKQPALLRYRMRTSASGKWSEPQTTASFQFLEPTPGRYRVEVAASLDGGAHWQAEPTVVEFVVLRPWYQQWWAYLALVVALGAAAYLAHRARVAVLLRLQRQRAAIARDLHDEIGSGMGGIGILAGVLSDLEVSETERRKLTAQIHTISQQLGESLGDIVWSLRRESEWLDALPLHLGDRGSALFAGDDVRFRSEVAELPRARIAPRVRRNVQLIALEAMHNAAKHAQANEVRFGIAPVAGGFHLWVRDDGRGMDAAPDPSTTGGVGLDSMSKRARSINATLHIDSGPERGTSIELWFSLDGRPMREPFDPRPRRIATARSSDRELS